NVTPELETLHIYLHDTSSTVIYTLSLHDALPIYWLGRPLAGCHHHVAFFAGRGCQCHAAVPATGRRPSTHGMDGKLPYRAGGMTDRKSTRLNSSHVSISYAVFCLKKKRIENKQQR